VELEEENSEGATRTSLRADLITLIACTNTERKRRWVLRLVQRNSPLSLQSLPPIVMGFVILPALIPDISVVYDVYFAAFANDAVTRALFPKASVEDLTNPESEFRYVLQY
jgi:hypothetical protein